MTGFWNAAGSFFTYTLIAVFFQNTILTRALGTSTALFVVRKKVAIPVFTLVLTVITVCCGVITWLIEPLIVSLKGEDFLRPLFYVAVIGVVYTAAILGLSHPKGRQKSALIPMVHMSAFNCAVFGALLLAKAKDCNLPDTVGFGIGTGLGFGIAAFFVSAGYERLNSKDIPAPFRGLPATLLYLGLLSLAFYGIIGHELPF